MSDLTSAQRSHNARHRGLAHKVRTRQVKSKRSPAFGQWLTECLTCGSSCLYGSRDSAMEASQCHRETKPPPCPGARGRGVMRRDPAEFRALLEDAEFIASTGGGFEECAKRVGKTPGALERLLRITGHAHLLHRLRANDPELNWSLPRRGRRFSERAL